MHRTLIDLSLFLSRTMKDLWDEDQTDACRLRFINSMYKFPSTPAVQLSSGHRMPILGVSTWLKHKVQETVELALRSGFRCVSHPLYFVTQVFN